MLNRKILSSFLVIFIAGFGVAAISPHSEFITMTAHCVDDVGNPVAGAEIQLSFEKPTGGFDTKRGLSDEDGYFSHHAEVFTRIYTKANKEGYYQYEKNFKPYRMDGNLAILKNGAPVYEDQKVDLILKPIKTPIPLHAYANWELSIPVKNEKVGFDIILGDWVSPYGQGKLTDIYFEYHSEYRGQHDYNGKLTMVFPNDYDGYVEFDVDFENGSELKSSYLAPKDGYKSKKIWEFQRQRGVMFSNTGERTGNYNDYNEPTSYWLRLRTVVDENGKIKEAIYAKIYKDIRFGGVYEKAFIHFTSVFANPKLNSRNLEFDRKNNLFRDLKIENRPRYP
jgi:hypothetical protein